MASRGRLSVTLALVGAALLLVTAANAQYFNFRTTFTPNPVPASLGGQLNVSNGANMSGLFAGTFGTNIVLTNFTTSSIVPDPAFETINAPYDIFVEMQLAAPGGAPLSGWVGNHFTGTLSGTISNSSSNVNNTNNLVPQIYDFGGGNVFTVVRNSYVPPGAPNAQTLGAIGAHVTGPLAVPEPGTLSLLFGSGIGGSLLFLRRRIRRR